MGARTFFREKDGDYCEACWFARPRYIDGTFVRTARKEHGCDGNGAAGEYRAHAEGCARKIAKGERYVEYVGEVAAFQSGSRHTVACADAFFQD